MRINLNKGISILAIAVLFVTSSCQKENLPEGTFSARMERHSNRDIKVTYNGVMFNWTQDDIACAARQSISGTDYFSGIYKATAVSNNVATLTYLSGAEVTDGTNYTGKFYAYLPASIYNVKSANTNRVTLPSSYSTDGSGDLIAPPMYTESTDKYLEFKNLCGMMCLKLATPNTNTYITKIKITTDKKIQGTFDVTFTGTVPTIAPYPSNQSVDDAEKSIVLNTLTNIIGAGHDFFIPLPEGEYGTLVIKMYTADGKVCTKTMTSPNKLNIIRSQYTVVDLTDITLDFVGAVGAKGGYFSVSGDTKIQFSQGNLQYRAKKQDSDSINTWRFALNQYDHVFTQDLTTSSSDVPRYYGINCTTWVDLFGWGTGILPYVLDDENGHYGNPRNNFNSNIATTEYDWGVGCEITNGGSQPGLWRTMTQLEWNYLFNGSSRVDKWARATVCGVCGIILLPDDWTYPNDFITHFTCGTSSHYETNSISNSDWLKIESLGAVFLPVTGYRYYSSFWRIRNTTVSGYYWSSSYDINGYAYRKVFDDANNNDCTSAPRRNGFAVRLVRDANNEWQQE